MTYSSGNVTTSTSSVTLVNWRHPVFKEGVYAFQRFEEKGFTFAGQLYQYRAFTLPPSFGRTTEATNRSVNLVMPGYSYRVSTVLPIVDLMRAFDALTGTTLEALEIETHSQRLIRNTFYQVRAAGLIDGDAVFDLQCAGFDPGWPLIPALTPTYQIR